MQVRACLVGLWAVVAVAAWSSGARADGFAPSGAASAGIFVLLFGEPIVGVGGLVVAVGNAAADNDASWRAPGYVFGGLNAGLSVFWFIVAADVGTDVPLGLGIAHVALAALDIGLAAFNGSKPPATRYSERYAGGRPAPSSGLDVSLAPVLAATPDGDARYGLQLLGRF